MTSQMKDKLMQNRGLIFISIFVVCISIATVAFMAKIEPAKFYLKPMSKLKPLKPEIRDQSALADLEHLAYEDLVGAVSILLTPEENSQAASGESSKLLLYAGLANGSIISLDDQEQVDIIINYTGSTGPKYYTDISCGDSDYYYFMETKCGRPMSLAWDIDGLRIMVADGYEGLMMVDPKARVKVSLSAVDPKGEGYKYLNSVAVSRSTGRVYFTETSTLWERRFDVSAQLESKPTGRLFMYDPADGQTHELLARCYNPTGVLVVEDGEGGDDYVIFAEQSRARLRRFMLKNWKPNTKVLAKPDIWLENLPCLPLGLAWADKNHKKFLVACISRNFMTDFLPSAPLFRQFMFSFPDWLYRFMFVNPSQVLRVSLRKKEVVGTLEKPSWGAESFTTITPDKEGRLYLGGVDYFFRGIPRTRKPVLPSD
eukprot:g25930.t1